MATSAYRPEVTLRPWSEGDLELLRQISTPEMTVHLGGPETEAQIVKRHHRYLDLSEGGGAGIFRVVLLPGGETAGTVGFWDREWQGEAVYEAGWSVLPAFQGMGIATAAVSAAVGLARAAAKHRFLHAYPSVHNHASNAVCRRAGFELLGECEFEYPPGHVMRCNDWRIDLVSAQG